jgi:REP element-mobilizing transposase RayT
MSLYTRHDPEGQPSLITTNTHERQRILLSAPTAEMLIETLYATRKEVGLLLLAFVIMPDHVHLVVVGRREQLGRGLQLLKGRFARAYNQRARRSGAVWQSRYHERTLRTEEALANAIEYVHNNPVVARLVEEPAEYTWSSANPRYATDLDAYFGQAEA